MYLRVFGINLLLHSAILILIILIHIHILLLPPNPTMLICSITTTLIIHHSYTLCDSKLQTHLFRKSFPPQILPTHRTASRTRDCSIVFLCFSFSVIFFVQHMSCRVNWPFISVVTHTLINTNRLIDYLIYSFVVCVKSTLKYFARMINLYFWKTACLHDTTYQ